MRVEPYPRQLPQWVKSTWHRRHCVAYLTERCLDSTVNPPGVPRRRHPQLEPPLKPHLCGSSPLGRTLGGLRFDWQVRFRNGTNLGINGLVSADRNNKATLLLTTPRCTIKSSAKDLSLRIVKLQYTSNTDGFFHPRCNTDLMRSTTQRPIRIRLRCRRGRNHRFLAWILT